MFKPLALSFALLLSPLAWADAPQDISISDPYARAVPPGQLNSAAFMVLDNGSDNAHALISASSPVAETVELHTHVEVDGMMQMRPIDQIDLPAKTQTELKPGGLHVMLIGLKQDLNVDDSISVTLTFEDDSRAELTLPVRKIQMMGHHHH